MGVYKIKLPDVGEGIAEAELTEWHVKVGDIVQEDDILAVVMTDKAAVEVPSATAGKITVAEVEEIVEPGELEPSQIHTPGIYVNRVIKGNFEKRIERVTTRD